MDTLLFTIVTVACATVVLLFAMLVIFLFFVARFILGDHDKLYNENGEYKRRVYELLDDILWS
jgi:uncharacterized membrane protein